MLDQQIINELVEIMEDDLGILIDTYLEDAQDKLICLRTMSQSEEGLADSEALRETAHSLKGASRNVGAELLAGHCGALESDARCGDLSRIHEHFEKISQEFTVVQQELQAIP